MFVLVLLVASSVLCLTSGQSPTMSGPRCGPTKISKIKFSYISYRNGNGQWMSQVGLQYDGGQLSSNKTSPWSLDVEQTTATSCDGDKTINVVANIAAPGTPPHISAPASPPPTSGPASSPPKKTVPADYELIPGVGHYKFHTKGTSWATARQTCADEGAHLVIINSENEAQAMKDLLVKTPKNSLTGDRKDAIWVGILEPKGTKTYFTIFGEPLESTGFSRWSPGDPNESGSDACIWLYEVNAGLADHPCSSLYPFVCEIELQS